MGALHTPLGSHTHPRAVRTPAENFPDADWDDVGCFGLRPRRPFANRFPTFQVMNVNLNAVWILARDFGRHMLSSRGGINGEVAPTTPNPRGRGKIINVASLCTFQGQFPFSCRSISSRCSSFNQGGITVPAYAAAKHGVAGMASRRADRWAPVES